MKIAHISVLAALVVATQVAFAQPPAGFQSPSGPPPGFPGSSSGATTTTTTTSGDPGNVSNVGSITSSTSTDVLPTDTSATDTSISDTSTKGELANTGGEPQIMLMAGLVLAACGLLLRRKTAGQAI